MLKEKNNTKHKQAKQQVFDRTEVLSLEAAAKGIDTYGNQRQTDGQYNGTADNRREEATDALEHQSKHCFKNTADNRSTHHSAIGDNTAAQGCNDTGKYTDKAGACTHDNRYLATAGTNGI